MNGPCAVVSLRDASTGRTLLQVGSYALKSIYSSEASEPISLNIRQSNAVFHLRILGVDSSSSCLLIRDGQCIDLVSDSSDLLGSQFLLRDDIENHSLIVTVGGKLGVSFNVRVHVCRAWESNGTPVLSAAKWTEADVKTASAEYLAARVKLARQRSLLEVAQARLSFGAPPPKTQTVQLLHDAILACLRLLATARKLDLVSDYSITEDADIDIEETIEFLRAHPTMLRPTEAGPVVFGGRRFTPAGLIPKAERSRKLDLSVPLSVLAHAKLLVEQDYSFGIFRLLLREVYDSLSRFNDAKHAAAKGEAISVWLSQAPQTQVARALKARVLDIWRLSAKLCSLEEWESHPSRVLRDSFRDFDLFEWAVFTEVCESLGFTGDRGSLLQASVACSLSTVVNPNAAGGAALVSQLLPGWRDGSVFASQFRPDLIIHHQRRIAIPVDAKFRVANNLVDPCSPDSVKEVQAYLNEFGCCGAIVIVPLIPSALFSGDHGAAVRVNGAISGREYRIWIVEYSPSLPNFGLRLQAAIEDIAALADSAQ